MLVTGVQTCALPIWLAPPLYRELDSVDFVAFFVDGAFTHDHYSHHAPTRFSLEILDASRKHTVFDNHTARSEQTLRDHKHDKG